MRISRLYCQSINTIDTEITLPGELSHYLIRVLRLKKGHNVIFFNNEDGLEYFAEIITADPKAAVIVAKTSQVKQNESNIDIHLFQALSKGDKLELVIQKATELGVKSITPILSTHVDYKLTAEKQEKKQFHWQKIAISAAEQSGRVFVPKVHQIALLDQALAENCDLKLILHPKAHTNIKTLKQQYPNARRFHIFIGPEGGLSQKEVDAALNHHAIDLQLGARILRTETAPLAICAILQTLWGDF
ncbi:16S rRNA (uracil(1498)-N(3))-methyltransferase [Facilibium subflavum]|uniref:16S rRNA (uracil(1498)-N(3))-methyltransferase n=1 Tax=Facilibium subflavum TaxID=2219058 RepID=UPI000E650246|nr:16S rRNA (uracil(1498)-N(3))-methyltransferase [Facilibium subflavum]